MKLNETLWAVVYNERKYKRLKNVIVDIGFDKSILSEKRYLSGWKLSQYKLIQVRIIPVKGAKRGKS